MKIKYSEEADILLITLRDGIPEDSIDLKEGVILHLDQEGLPLEIEVLDAAKLAMLKEISVTTSFGESEAAHGKAVLNNSKHV